MQLHLNVSIFQSPLTKINYIEAIDQGAEGPGSKVILTKGGLGQQSVEMKFTSPKSHGFSFIVEIFGKP